VIDHFKSYLDKDESKGVFGEMGVYPLASNFSLLLTMPKDAHKSYIKAGLEWCEFMLKHNPTSADEKKRHENNKKLARAFIKKHQK
jgi:hypothetical protein